MGREEPVVGMFTYFGLSNPFSLLSVLTKPELKMVSNEQVMVSAPQKILNIS